MAIFELSEATVQQLIRSTKYCEHRLSRQDKSVGKIKDDTPVIDFTHNIEYTLHRYRHPIDPSRFSIHLRFKITNAILIRIDINNGTHTNPDGTKIGQNHMHLYRESAGPRKDAIAMPLPDDIHNISTFLLVLDAFLAYTHIKQYHKV